MAGNSITLFGSDPPTGANSYVQDAFSDITDTPSNNTGWSSTISSNPMNNFYGNDDAPRFGPKTLWIKDLVLEQNRQQWVNGLPTYRIVWHEPFPSAQGYVYGDIQLIRRNDQTSVLLKTTGEGFGVGGVFARCMAIMVGSGAENLAVAAGAAATGTVSVDGVANSTSFSFGNAPVANPRVALQYSPMLLEGANEAYNIHDFRINPAQAQVFQISGVIVYSENPSLSIDQFPGVTYNNKTRSASSVNTTLALPSMGNSMGGVATIWKNAAGGYSMSLINHAVVSSTVVTGSSGTNLIAVTAGQGSSFNVGDGLIAASSAGATPYFGIVRSISTDTLTMFQTMSFGLGGSVFRYFQSGSSIVINTSLNVLAMTFGATEISRFSAAGGASSPVTQGWSGLMYADPYLRYYVWGLGVGVTTLAPSVPGIVIDRSSSSVLCLEGNFSAVDFEWSGASAASTLGIGAFNINSLFGTTNVATGVGFTGIYRHTVLGDAPSGWNSVMVYVDGSGDKTAALSRINMWQRNRDISASYGILGKMDVLPAFYQMATMMTNGATNITAHRIPAVSPGMFQRVYADQIMFRGPWVRAVGYSLVGNVGYIGSTTTCTATMNYFGTHFCVHGQSFGLGGSLNLSLDAGTNQGVTSISTVVRGTSNTFHSISFAVLGGTVVIYSAEFYRQYGEMKNIQTFSGVTSASQNPIPIMTRWMPYSLGTTGLGAITQAQAYWRRVGTDCEIRGEFVTGLGINATYCLFLPNALTTDGSLSSIYNASGFNALFPPIYGHWYHSSGSSMLAGGVTLPYTYLSATPYNQFLTFHAWGMVGSAQFGSTATFGGVAGGANSGVAVAFSAKVPIAGWEVDR